MRIDVVELGNRIKAARNIDGVLIGQARFLQQIDPNEELAMNQSALSAVERGQSSYGEKKLEELAKKVGVEIPYLTNGTGSEVLENLASDEAQEAPRQAVARHLALTTQARAYSSHPVINALNQCSREIEALPDAATRGLVVDVLLRLYVEPFLEKHKD